MNATESLRELLGGYGIDASEHQATLMLRHLELLNEKNATTNLTRVTSTDEAMVIHVLDSLLPLPHLSELVNGFETSLLDIGTGGGYPGIPLACMTEWDVTLIDSVGKKASAVQDFIEGLGLGGHARALHVRAENLARERPDAFNLVVTRAVAQANVLIEYASPLLCDGGHLALYKARPSDDELAAAKRAAKICGMDFVSRETFELPNEAGHRELLYFMKVAKPRIRLPRRAGMATKEPLGL